MHVTHYLSQIRVIFLALLGTILLSIFLIGAAVYFSSSEVIAYLGRERANLTYDIFYKFPGEAFSLAASPELSRGNAQSVPVLLYHGEGADSDMPTATFVAQMRALKADGWNTISTEQFDAFIKKGTPVPAKSFLLTFDDGRKDTFYQADPVLNDLGFRGVMFVITGFSLPANGAKSNYYLNQQELNYMAASGRWDIESHGDEDHALYVVPAGQNSTSAGVADAHFLSNKFFLSAEDRVETSDEFTERITKDLTQSQAVLKKDFNSPATAFAFPFNDYGQNTVNFDGSEDILATAAKQIYSLAFYQVPADKEDFNNYPNPDGFMIKRIEPTAGMSGTDLAHTLDAAATKSLPYRTQTFGTEWISNWGSVKPQGSTLDLQATAQNGGAATLLDGSELWQDYALAAQINWKSGEDASLIARYQSDSKTFLSCVFSKDSIALETHENGTQKVSAHKSYAPGDTSNMEIRMTANSNLISCSAGGVTVSSNVNDSFVHNGQIGVQIWDPALGISELHVNSVSVNTI